MRPALISDGVQPPPARMGAQTATISTFPRVVPVRRPDEDEDPQVLLISPRILVVEDDDLVRDFAVKLLESLDYPVISAADGMEAMRLLEEVPSIDLVFTDVVMPGIDGIVLADMMKRRRPELKILYTTGYRDIARAKAEAGILHGNILEKPYRPAELEMEIHKLLA